MRAVDRVDVLVLSAQDFHLLARTWKHLGRLVDEVAAQRDGDPTAASSPEPRSPESAGPPGGEGGAGDARSRAPA